MSISRPRQSGHSWQIVIKGGAVATKKFSLTNPARAVVDLPAAYATGIMALDLDTGPFERLRVGKQGDQVRLVLDLRGVVSPKQIKFTLRGNDLVIEVPMQALARR
jgi:hypothetical protein